jgi:hypothetical protein
VDDQEFYIAGKAEPLGKSLASVLGVHIKERPGKEKGEKQAQKCSGKSKKTVMHGEDSLSLDAWSPPAV